MAIKKYSCSLEKSLTWTTHLSVRIFLHLITEKDNPGTLIPNNYSSYNKHLLS